MSGFWVTNGTSAGTSELSVAGGSSFTVFGSEVLFEGGDGGLWVTNGTAAGTSELSVMGAFPRGFDPGDFTVLGNEVSLVGVTRTAPLNFGSPMGRARAHRSCQLPRLVRLTNSLLAFSLF